MNAKRANRAGQTNGFTIIEILIVLAIGGLILLLVFLAIPQLERVNRNGQRKQDVAAILTAVSHYELSNSGNFPPASPPATVSTLMAYTPLNYYAQSDITVVPQDPAAASPHAPMTDTEAVVITNYAQCDESAGAYYHGSTTSGADYRSVVALYAVETANGGSTPQCQQL